MDTVYVVYKTDVHHSYASRDLIGLGTTQRMAIDICKQQAKKEDDRIDSDQLFNLINIRQTQGYSGEGEFHMECLPLDTLL